MKLNTFKKLTIATVITITGAASLASAADRLHVSVPFSFMVGNTKMAAGDYSITQSENGMVTIEGAKTSAMVLTVPGEMTGKATSALSFTGDSNPTLKAIVVSGSVSREIPLHSATDRKPALVSAR
jgi:hypothetical protein